MSHYFRIEKSGCCAHKGLMQIRVDIHKKSDDSLLGIHLIYFEPTVTDEEILFCAEIAMDWKKNGKPMKNTYNGKSVPTLKNNKSDSQNRITEIQDLDFTTIENAGLYSVRV
jgi:hypothetical protein